MSIEHPNPPLPPLTADEFNDGAGFTYRGVPIIENENATHVYAYGHVDAATMAGAVNDYDAEMVGVADETVGAYVASEVQHTYAVTLKTPSDPDGWWISWQDVTAETPGAFPVTVVSR